MHKHMLATFLLIAAVTVSGVGPALADSHKSVALILDASGSMQAKLKNGVRRIDAAKDAVEKFAKATPDNVRLSLWAYGHQSPRKEKNCQDIQQLTNYSAIGTNRDEVIAKTRSLTAQGYTPISTILERAAKGLKSETSATSRVVVLVSDGRETCGGDACAVARALSQADASLTVHTIGFAVDVAARYELQCIAKQARGNYYEADDVNNLSNLLSTAVKVTAIAQPKKVVQTIAKPGSLKLTNSSASRQVVFNSITNEEVGSLGPITPSIPLPAGIYRVKFGNAYWRGIEVKDGEATEIDSAIISLPNASYLGHEIRDWETEEIIGKLSSQSRSMNLMPSTFKVMFGTMAYTVRLEPGKRTIIPAGRVKFDGLPINSRSIFNADGKEVITVSATGSSATLLAGGYELEHNGKRYPFVIQNGQDVVVSLK